MLWSYAQVTFKQQFRFNYALYASWRLNEFQEQQGQYQASSTNDLASLIHFQHMLVGPDVLVGSLKLFEHLVSDICLHLPNDNSDEYSETS